MRFDNRTAMVLKKAARGPAAIALRQQRIMRNPAYGRSSGASAVIQGGLGAMSAHVMRVHDGAGSRGARLVSGGVGMEASARTRLVSAGTGGVPGGTLSGLGVTGQTEDTAKSGAISIGSGAVGTAAGPAIAAYIGAGSAAGPIGAAVGLIVGIVVTELLKKNYLNVANVNAAQDAELNVFQRYQQVMGRAPGRAIGLDGMRAIWKGSMHVKMWNRQGADATQCFHEGCFKYPGRGDWVDGTITGDFPKAFSKWYAAQNAAPVPNTSVRSVAIAPTRTAVRTSLLGYSGLGSLGATNLPAAVDFIDNYYLPQMAGTWVVPANATEHQILYDTADAFLAKQPAAASTAPYVAIPNAEYSPQAPTQTVPQPTNIVPPGSSGPSATTSYPGYTPIPGLVDTSGRQLYVVTNQMAQAGIIPAYTPIGGQMVQDGSFNNAVALPSGPVVSTPPGGWGGQPIVAPLPATGSNTYPLVPVAGPGGTTVYQQQPGTGAAPAPAAAGGGLSLGPIIALAAGALAFMR